LPPPTSRIANLERQGTPVDPGTVAKAVRALKPHLSEEEIENGCRELSREGLM
jgi:uncharacterized protein (DUF2267 family)